MHRMGWVGRKGGKNCPSSKTVDQYRLDRGARHVPRDRMDGRAWKHACVILTDRYANIPALHPDIYIYIYVFCFSGSLLSPPIHLFLSFSLLRLFYPTIYSLLPIFIHFSPSSSSSSSSPFVYGWNTDQLLITYAKVAGSYNAYPGRTRWDSTRNISGDVRPARW